MSAAETQIRLPACERIEDVTEVKLGDLLDEQELAKAIENSFVRRQVHPSQPLAILNYTERCQYERGAWNGVTRTCRGLIVNADTDAVVARPWPKFFNHGQEEAGILDLAAPAEVTDKFDGSLGICYPVPDGWAIATRGSFASEQALHATTMLHSRYPGFRPPEGVTVLFEICYPANRIVLDYGDLDDLVLLGAVDIATGRDVPMDAIGWPGPRTTVFAAATLAEALALPPRENAEGVVVHYFGTDVRVKIKQADYQALHRILTGTSARSVWEYLAVAACKDLIAKPLHWGSRLGLDPDRAAEILAIGPEWMRRLIEGVPDEFHAWLREVISNLDKHVSDLAQSLAAQIAGLRAVHADDRKALALAIRDDPHSGALFLLLDSRDITTYLWREVYPAAEKPWGMRSEDVA